jgi:hypothetical protein
MSFAVNYNETGKETVFDEDFCLLLNAKSLSYSSDARQRRRIKQMDAMVDDKSSEEK